MNPVRVLIVDDSAFMRKAIRRMLEADPEIEVVGVARDGAEGVRLARELVPDLITLDFQMPDMNGLRVIEEILAWRSIPILMLSSFTAEGSEVTLRAFELGALDYIDKSSVKTQMDIVNIAPMLRTKVKTLAGIGHEKLARARVAAVPQAPPPPFEAFEASVGEGTSAYDLVAIGSSTGGPSALQAILAGLPRGFPCPIVIVQHMPAGFTGPLADRLNSICEIRVREGANGDELAPGTAYIAPAGSHVLIARRGNGLQMLLSQKPEDALHRPSVDVLFASVARTVGAAAVGVLLTGMGKDGALGLKTLRDRGAATIAQDETTSVVWGMPRVAVEIGAAREVLPLGDIRGRILALARERRTAPAH